MPESLIVSKAKNARSKRALEYRAPQIHEHVKKVVCLKGPSSSKTVNQVLKDVCMLKKPDAIAFTKRNMTRPFEDISTMEFLCKQNDTSLFLYGSHSKKRPHNIIIGRMFDFGLLNMIEFGVNMKTFKSMKSLSNSRPGIVRPGGKPMFVFLGDFDANPEMQTAKNVLLDFFRGEVMDIINLAALDHVIICTAQGKDKIFFRHYCVRFKKSGGKIPRVQLEPYGPNMDLTIRRSKSAPIVTQYKALKVPATKPPTYKRKNIEKGAMGTRTGRIHLDRQELNKLQLRKSKGLKKRKKPSKTKNPSKTQKSSR